MSLNNSLSSLFLGKQLRNDPYNNQLKQKYFYQLKCFRKIVKQKKYAYKQHIFDQLSDSMEKKPAEFWKILKSFFKTLKFFINLIFESFIIIFTSSLICHMFNSFFYVIKQFLKFTCLTIFYSWFTFVKNITSDQNIFDKASNCKNLKEVKSLKPFIKRELKNKYKQMCENKIKSFAVVVG
jgi:hypothetical protein